MDSWLPEQRFFVGFLAGLVTWIGVIAAVFFALRRRNGESVAFVRACWLGAPVGVIVMIVAWRRLFSG